MNTIRLTTLPFDLLAEILCRLPLKLLLQLQCLCKSFKHLISDRKFAKKHLCLSTKHYHLIVTSANNLGGFVLYDSSILSVLSASTITQTQLIWSVRFLSTVSTFAAKFNGMRESIHSWRYCEKARHNTVVELITLNCSSPLYKYFSTSVV